MGKSIRSQLGKRLRAAKRTRVEAMVVRPRVKAHHEALQRVIEGRIVKLQRPKNAFKYPEADGACFPQHEVMKPIDYRSQNLPMAGYAFRGNRRKYSGEQAAYMEQVARTMHPEMKVLAGGGAILAKDGRRVSAQEAAILATVSSDPQVAAKLAPVASAADAVQAAVAEEAAASAAADVSMDPIAAAAPQTSTTEASKKEVNLPEPTNEADHTRVPVLKDARRAKRVAEHRPRPNSVKKKTKSKGSTPQSSSSKQEAASAEPVAAPTAVPATTSSDSAQAATGKKRRPKKNAGNMGVDAAPEDDAMAD